MTFKIYIHIYRRVLYIHFKRKSIKYTIFREIWNDFKKLTLVFTPHTAFITYENFYALTIIFSKILY